MRTGRSLGLVALSALLGACGGPEGGGGGTCIPGITAAIDIRPAGATPPNVCMLPGGTVTFTNSDTAPHDIRSGSCPNLNLGVIPPAGSRAATLPTAAVCPYHDELDLTATAFQGIVAVTTGPAQGPGY